MHSIGDAWSIRMAVLACVMFLAGCSDEPAQQAVRTTGSETIIIKNVTLYDVDNRVLNAGQNIVVQKGKIASIGTAPPPTGPGDIVIDGTRLLALPGFVNTHTHLWQHIARSFEPAAILQDWIKIYRYAHYLMTDEIRNVTFIAAKQAQLSGITTVSDFASVNFQSGATAATIEALQQAKMGGHVVWWNPASFQPSALRTIEIEQLSAQAAPLDVVMGFGPLSFFDVAAVYDGIRIAQTNGIRMTEHTMENPQEARAFRDNVEKYLAAHGSALNEEDRAALQAVLKVPAISNVDGVVKLRRFAGQMLKHDGTGTPLSDADIALLKPLTETLPTMIPLLDHLEVLDDFLAIHSVWLNDSDFEAYVANNTAVSHNPESNMYLSSGAAPVPDYLMKGILVSLGTDGAASNDRIDALTAMRNMVNLQKAYNMNAALSAKVDPWTVLQAATINGAKAMGLQDRTGSLVAGKEADIVLISREALGLSPYVPDKDAVAIIINSATIRSVVHVISDGELVVSQGKLVGYDEAALAEQLNQIVAAVLARTEQGKKWSLSLPAGGINFYASIRKADSISIAARNSTSGPRFIRLAFSGTPFGGAVAGMLGERTLNRFPADNPPDYYDKTFEVAAGTALTIKKPSGSYDYQIIWEGHERIKRTGTAEQILLLDVTGQ